MSNLKKQVSQDVALAELTTFLKKHKQKEFRRNQITEESIKEDYVDVIEAIEDGNLVFDKHLKPVYTLRESLFNEAEDSSLKVTEINFRQRIKPADRNLLMDGLDVQKQIGTYTLKYISFICSLSMIEVKELGKDDFEVLNQLCSVF